MASASDLIDHFKLDAQVYPDRTHHTFYTSDHARGRRKVKVEKVWHKHKKLGQGGFGAVWLEVEHEGKIKAERAVKEIPKNNGLSCQIDYKRELLAMAKFSKYQEVFVQFYGWFENVDTIFLAMEYFTHGDLHACMTAKLTEYDAKIITAQLLEGLKIMHENGFTHRDLKPKNILVVRRSPDWWVKIGDFGITKRVESDHTALRTQAGTEHFQAPEMFGYVKENEERSEYTNAVDIWSLGCVIFQILTHQVPFFDLRALRLYSNGTALFPTEALSARCLSTEGIDFIKSLLVPQPLKRLAAETALEDPWLKTTVEAYAAESWPKSAINRPKNVREAIDVTAKQHQALKITETSYDPPLKAPKPHDSPHSTSPQGLDLSNDASHHPADHKEALRLLQANNFHVEANSFDSVRALHWAAENGYEAVVRLLLEKEVDIEAMNGDSGRTALHLAARNGHKGVVRLLLENGANITTKDERGFTALHIAAIDGHKAVVKLLLENGANITAKDESELTALHIAIIHRHKAVVQLLLENGANITAKNEKGRTALHMAILNRDKAMVQLLLENKADVRVKNNNGRTALQIAAMLRDESVVQLLLENGADISEKDIF
ncbi:MAG: hypothetical protein M1830_009566 [Pleopsidium flavum]|nr:MAG: hypothetical protein M1830_009566 [Pleopsidium flavum]